MSLEAASEPKHRRRRRRSTTSRDLFCRSAETPSCPNEKRAQVLNRNFKAQARCHFIVLSQKLAAEIKRKIFNNENECLSSGRSQTLSFGSPSIYRKFDELLGCRRYRDEGV